MNSEEVALLRSYGSVSTLQPDAISLFKYEHSFLSNFYLCPPNLIYIPAHLAEGDERSYRSTEHAYQAAKYTSMQMRDLIRATDDKAGEAKRLGQSPGKRRDFDDLRIVLMYLLQKQKYKDPMLRTLLLRTGERYLCEGNNWHDMFWGRCTCAKHKGEGWNWLGILLMHVRSEVQRGSDNL